MLWQNKEPSDFR